MEVDEYCAYKSLEMLTNKKEWRNKWHNSIKSISTSPIKQFREIICMLSFHNTHKIYLPWSMPHVILCAATFFMCNIHIHFVLTWPLCRGWPLLVACWSTATICGFISDWTGGGAQTTPQFISPLGFFCQRAGLLHRTYLILKTNKI